MSSLHVCPASQVRAVLARSAAGWAVSALASTRDVPNLEGIAAERRLHLAVSDVVAATPDHVLADRHHMDDLLAFLRRWDRATPMLVHCYAGVSRSTAVAFVALCALEREVGEDVHARRLRAASPTATPNRRLVALADAALGRQGRMVDAIAAIGRGAECFEGTVFTLPVVAGASREAALDATRPQPA